MENKKDIKEIRMSLHELNKTVIASLPALNKEGLEKLRTEIESIVSEKGKYYMLLSNERKDYTVFAFVNSKDKNFFVNEVVEVLESRGTIKEFDSRREDSVIEIWVDSTFYALFPYDAGIIEI